eukprot:TRINITY_DN5071_c0_g1_i3.p4 TRINITY_DN5071_c0_g1~~TRINITY_DN5071_c0_g1_i3.p4  ORF type:complete len:111 (+),score=14.19 TRINITY_DN5071_c0_g1_i3:374-706(+)
MTKSTDSVGLDVDMLENSCEAFCKLLLAVRRGKGVSGGNCKSFCSGFALFPSGARFASDESSFVSSGKSCSIQSFLCSSFRRWYYDSQRGSDDTIPRSLRPRYILVDDDL